MNDSLRPHVLALLTACLLAGGAAGADVPVSLFPGVARLAGANGTAWRSSAVLHNATAAPQTALLELIPRDGAAVSVSKSVQLAPGETYEISNLYDYLQAADGAGMLRVTGAVVAWVRAYNEGNGTFGQDVAPVEPGRGFAAMEARLFPLSTPADIKKDFRSNLVLVNLDAVDITVTLTAGDATATKVVPAGAYAQINNLGAFLKLAPGFGPVQVSADGRWFGVIATIDPFTGDPTTVYGLSASDLGERYFPGIAQKAGANGAAWRAEALLFNPGQSAVSAQLDLIPRGANQVIAGKAVTLAPGETRRIANLYDFFGVAEGAGTLHVTGGALAWVRAYNQRPHAGDSAMETFGQDVPPVSRRNAIGSREFVVLPFMTPVNAASGFRSNLVLLNIEVRDITVSLRAGGVTKTQVVPAGSYVQIDKLGAFMGTPVGARCVWATADGRWATAIATIDPTTNDPTTFRPVEGLQPPSSADLINRALASGAITSEQALTYKVLADFADPRLPVQYLGDDRGTLEPTSVGAAARGFSSLSPATQNLVGPFLVPPFLKGSWWDLRHGGGAGAPKSAGPTPALTCLPWVSLCGILSGSWEFVTGAHVRVWFQTANRETDLAIADDLMSQAEFHIWGQLMTDMGTQALLKDLGNGPRLDVALVDGIGASGDSYGSWTPYGDGCGAKPGYIEINRSYTDAKLLRATLAHEMMHAFQHAFTTNRCSTEYDWLGEATATWFEDASYQDADTEQEYREYLTTTKLSLDDTSVQYRQYSAYLFFFYLTRVKTLAETVIGDIWKGTEKMDSLQAIDAAIRKAGTDLDTVWPDFAVHNWNSPPFADYLNIDLLEDSASTERTASLAAKGGDGFTELDSSSDIVLPHLSIRYYQFDAADPSVSLVAFYNGLKRSLSKISVPQYGQAFSAKPASDPAAVKGAHVDALIQIDGKWQHEDWTDRPARSLCLDLNKTPRKERFTSLVVILSNSDISTDHKVTPQGDYPPGLLVSNIGCAAWEGYANLTFTWGKVVTEQMVTSTFRLEYVDDGYYDENTPLFRYYKATTGGFAWSGSGTDNPDKYTSCTYTGQATGSIVHDLDIFHTLAYVTGGAGKRGLESAGLFFPWLSSPIALKYTCKGGTSGEKPWSGGEFTLNAIPGDTSSVVSSGGKAILIDAAKTQPPRKITGTWSLQAKRDP